MNKRRALFLDRDGVINVDHAYVSRKEDFHFLDGIFELCYKAKQLNYLIVVITNQAGIGRGYYSEQDFLNLTDWMKEVFRLKGIDIDAVYFCPYHYEHGVGEYKKDSDCRKPRPGMIFQAENEYDIDLQNSLLIGDKISDIDAGIAADIGQNLLFISSATIPCEFAKKEKSVVISSLMEATHYLEAYL